jgi:hypothetical protein
LPPDLEDLEEVEESQKVIEEVEEIKLSNVNLRPGILRNAYAWANY